jgi:hypothetical protein
MKIPRRRFLHLAVSAVALPAGVIRLTYHDTTGRDGPAPAESVEAGAPENEITAAMINAAFLVLEEWGFPCEALPQMGRDGPMLKEMLEAALVARQVSCKT